MKKREPIDDLFQDRLKDFSLEAPMHLWDNIAEAAVPEAPENKRKGFLWLWLVPFLLLTAAGWAYFNSANGFSNATTNLGNFPVLLDNISTKETETESDLLGLDPIIASTENGSSVKEIVGVIANQSAQKTTDQAKASHNTFNPNVKFLKAGDLTNDQLLRPRGLADADQTERLSKQDEIIVDGKITKPTTEEAMTTTVDNSSAAENVKLPLWMLNPLPSAWQLVDNPLGDEVLTCPAFGAKSWMTTIDLMASMDFVMRQLDAKEAGFEDYARLRNNTETFRHGVSVGMRLSTISESGFAVRSGLNYSAINEQLNFKIKEEEKLTIITKYDVDGSIIGTDTSITTVGTYRIVNNRYTELDIPLLIGYEYVGEKVSFSFNGGTFINMLSAQKGEFVSPNSEEPVSFSSSDPDSYRAFKNRVGLGFYGSMGVYFQVKDNMQVLFEPYAKWRPGSYTVDGYVLDQRFLTTGLFVGIRKRII